MLLGLRLSYRQSVTVLVLKPIPDADVLGVPLGRVHWRP